MGEFKGTKELLRIDYFDGKGGIIDIETKGEVLCQVYEVSHVIRHDTVQSEEHKSNAQLIADAFNVRQQINFDLPNLLKQRNEMLSMLEKVNATILGDTGGSLELIKLRREIESLIKEATEE